MADKPNSPLPLQLEELKKRENLIAQIQAISGRAEAGVRRRNYSGVLAGARDLEQICRKNDNAEGLSLSFCLQGIALGATGEYQQAVALFQEAEALDRQSGNLSGLGSALFCHALTMFRKGDRQEALTLCGKSSQAALAGGESELRLKNLVLAAAIEGNSDRLTASDSSLEQARRFAAVFNLAWPADISSAYHIPVIKAPDLSHKALGIPAPRRRTDQKSDSVLDGRMAELQDKERLYRAKNQRADLAEVLTYMAGVYLIRNNWWKARELLAEAENIACEDQNQILYKKVLELQTDLYLKMREFSQSWDVSRALENMCRLTQDKVGLARALSTEFAVLDKATTRDTSMIIRGFDGVSQQKLYPELITLYTELGGWEQLAALHQSMGDYQNPLTPHILPIGVMRLTGTPLALNDGPSSASTAGSPDSYQTAYSCYMEAERISREHYLKYNLAYALLKKGQVLSGKQKYDEALASLAESESLLREMIQKEGPLKEGPLKEGLLEVLKEKLEILVGKNDLGLMLTAAQEIQALTREKGNLIELTAVLSRHGDFLLSQGARGVAEYLNMYRENDHLIKNELRAGLAASIEQAAFSFFKSQPVIALGLYDELDRIYRELGDNVSLLRVLGNIELLLRVTRDKPRQAVIYASLEKIAVETQNWALLQNTFERQTAMLTEQGLNSEADALLESMAVKYPLQASPDGYIAVLKARCSLFKHRNDNPSLLQTCEQLESLYRSRHDDLNSTQLMGYRASIYCAGGEYEKSLAITRDVVKICREKGFDDLLAEALCNEGNVHYALNDMDKAIAAYDEAMTALQKSGNPARQLVLLSNKENVLKKKNDNPGLSTLYFCIEDLCRKAGEKDKLRDVLDKHAALLFSLNELDKSYEVTSEALKISQEQLKTDLVQMYTGNLGIILNKKGDQEGALARFQEQEKLCILIKNNNSLVGCLIQQAVIRKVRKETNEFLALVNRIAPLLKEIGDFTRLKAVFLDAVVFCKDQGKNAEAMEWLPQLEKLCREQNDKQNLLKCFNTQAAVCAALKNWQGALHAYQGWEEIYREANVLDGLASAFRNQAIVLTNLNRKQEALERANQALSLAKQTGNADLTQKSQSIIDKLKTLKQ